MFCNITFNVHNNYIYWKFIGSKGFHGWIFQWNIFAGLTGPQYKGWHITYVTGFWKDLLLAPNISLCYYYWFWFWYITWQIDTAHSHTCSNEAKQWQWCQWYGHIREMMGQAVCSVSWAILQNWSKLFVSPVTLHPSCKVGSQNGNLF